jgi:hypothetical protein
MNRFAPAAAALAALALAATAAHAWWVVGHGTIAEAAASGLPDDVPPFFRAGGKALAHYAGDPDRWKNPEARHLRAAEAPDHFLDLENFKGRPLPSDRYKAIALLVELKQEPDKTGMLPYAILENYDRLTCAFADYRAARKAAEGNDARPDELKAAEAKCLVYSGNLSHFTGDCAMPLHTTVDYDGRPGPDGKVLQKGIHAKIDAFPERNGFTPEEVGRGLKARKVEDVWAHTLDRIKESHAEIDRCYELDKAGAFDRPTEESRKFILARCRAAAQFTADLWYSAWLRSATLPKPY